MQIVRRSTSSGRVRVFLALCAAGISVAVLAWHPASGAGTPVAPIAVAPTIPSQVACKALIQTTGGDRNTNVPDFQLIPGAPTRVQTAEIVPATATQPEYCSLTGYVQTQVKFTLKLPTTTYQGRYLHTGCGGFCGAIPATTFPACRTELGGDFALSATNQGHDANGTDGLWGENKQARIDFGTRAVHVVSLASKAIIKAYYGQAPKKSYFAGCSEGGREALMEAQRYPGDFDGILAGAPANRLSNVPIYLHWVVATNRDSSGNPILTLAKLAPLNAAVIKACDANDSVTGDGLIGDPRDCSFNPASIQCPAADGPTCLTAAQVKVVKAIYAGIFDKQGRRLDPRMGAKGSELSWAGWYVPLPASATAPAGTPPTSIAGAFGESDSRWLSFPIGQGRPLDEVKLDVETHRLLAKATGSLYDPVNPDLTAFRKRGGKLMLYHGWADTLVPASMTLDYYHDLRKRMGGQSKLDEFTRLFMINGMGHCAGGPTPNTSDMTLQLVKWVEDGSAPTSIIASDTGPTGARQRPVYAYPKVPKYIGPNPTTDPTGPNKAANFVAANPSINKVDDVKWVGEGQWYTGTDPSGQSRYYGH